MVFRAVSFFWLIGVSSHLASPIAFNGSVYANPNGDGSYLAYLPPPAAANHAATIEQLPDSGLILAWFSGVKEEASGCAIALSRLLPGTTQWTTPVIVAERAGYSNQNPLLFYDKATNITHLYFSQVSAIWSVAHGRQFQIYLSRVTYQCS